MHEQGKKGVATKLARSTRQIVGRGSLLCPLDVLGILEHNKQSRTILGQVEQTERFLGLLVPIARDHSKDNLHTHTHISCRRNLERKGSNESSYHLRSFLRAEAFTLEVDSKGLENSRRTG
eukprot:3660621-Amphidinium_carterae.1